MTNANDVQILIADDEPTIREILSKALSRKGYRCTMAVDGKNALVKLKNHQFDIALLDISMPVKTGMDVLKEIEARYHDMATIMVTAISDLETAIKAMKMGAYDYITKPVDLNMLSLSVERALEKRRLILENKNYQLHLEEMVKEQTLKIRQSFLNSITSLAYALEAKDEYTSGHSQRVTKIASITAEEMGLPREDIEKIRIAGELHDVGKIGVREAVLNKAGKLTDEEYDHIKQHCDIGERILKPIVEDYAVLEMVRHHHERYDGCGYPDRLSGEQITQGAGIISAAEAYASMLSPGAMALAAADAYDAMTSDRPYRKAQTIEAACAELEKCRGKQFHPAVVDALIKVIKSRNDL